MKRTEIIPIRFTKEELEHLKECSQIDGTEKFKNGRNNFSEYLRVKLLSGTGKKNKIMENQLSDLRFEVRKIGININQITKKINGGFGTEKDLKEIIFFLQEIEKRLEVYQEEVKNLWQSQN